MQLLTQDAGDLVGSGPGGEGHDELHRMAGVILRRYRRCGACKSDRADELQHAASGKTREGSVSGRFGISQVALLLEVLAPWTSQSRRIFRFCSPLIGRKVAMLRCRSSFFALLLVPLCVLAQPKAPYYPDAAWQRKTPAEAGVDAQRLKDAVDYADANETRNPRDLTLNHYQTFGREPFGYAIGPIKDRGDPTGVVVHKGCRGKWK